jgi:hypothetical protein
LILTQKLTICWFPKPQVGILPVVVKNRHKRNDSKKRCARPS